MVDLRKQPNLVKAYQSCSAGIFVNSNKPGDTNETNLEAMKNLTVGLFALYLNSDHNKLL